MSFEDVRKQWQSEVDRPLAADRFKELLSVAQQKYSKLERTVYWRDLREIAAAMFVMVAFAAGWPAFYRKSLVAAAGAGILILAPPFIVYMLIRARRPIALPLDASVLDCSRQRLTWLDRQIQLLQTVAYWYVAPIFVGIVLFDWGLARGHWLFFSAHVATSALFCLFVIFLNRRAVRKQLLPIREELVQVIAGLERAD
jgi:hypothetical protein